MTCYATAVGGPTKVATGPTSAATAACFIESHPALPESPNALAGLLLIAAGLGGIATYVASILPPAIQLFCLMVAIGSFLLVREIGLNDPLVCGLTAGDAIAHAIRFYKGFMCHFAVLMSIPNITGGDVGVVMQGLCSSEDREKDDEAEVAVTQKSSTTNGHGSHSGASPAAAAESPVLGSLLLSDRGFAAASQWLKQPALSVGLGDQLRLYGLYQRSLTHSPADSAPLKSAGKSISWLQQATAEAQQACSGMSQAMARARLAPALAAADPLFAVAHPEFAAPKKGDHAGMMLSLVERRLSQELPAFLATFHRSALLASASLATTALLRSMWLRSMRSVATNKSRIFAWQFLMLAGAAGTAYSLALMKGLPMEVYVVVAKLLGVQQKKGRIGGGVERLWQYLMLLLAPRMRSSLFLKQ